jgi:hypothetical protein
MTCAASSQRIAERTNTLVRALEPMAKNAERPNNSLEAETSLLIIRLSVALVEGKKETLPAFWRDFAAILHRAESLGEFDADRLVMMIQTAAQVAGNDP